MVDPNPVHMRNRTRSGDIKFDAKALVDKLSIRKNTSASARILSVLGEFGSPRSP